MDKRLKPNSPRSIAKRTGSGFYFSDKPCRKGHFSARITSSAICLECHQVYNKTIRQSRERQYSVARFGLTLAQYEQLLIKQNHVCAICKNPEKILDHKTKKIKPLAIDHCHTTNKIRGLLCASCNIGIGHLKHNPNLLRKAALYCEVW